MKKYWMPVLCLLFLAECNNPINLTPTTDHAKKGGVEESSDNEADKAITQQIRQSLLDDNELSIQAKDVRILTVNGVVTLRGVVSSDAEKKTIANKAKAVKDVKSVDNQLEVVMTETPT